MLKYDNRPENRSSRFHKGISKYSVGKVGLKSLRKHGMTCAGDRKVCVPCAGLWWESCGVPWEHRAGGPPGLKQADLLEQPKPSPEGEWELHR